MSADFACLVRSAFSSESNVQFKVLKSTLARRKWSRFMGSLVTITPSLVSGRQTGPEIVREQTERRVTVI